MGDLQAGILQRPLGQARWNLFGQQDALAIGANFCQDVAERLHRLAARVGNLGVGRAGRGRQQAVGLFDDRQVAQPIGRLAARFAGRGAVVLIEEDPQHAHDKRLLIVVANSLQLQHRRPGQKLAHGHRRGRIEHQPLAAGAQAVNAHLERCL